MTVDFSNDFAGFQCGDTVPAGLDKDAGFIRRGKNRRSAAEEQWHHVWARETLVKDEESARELCESPSSMGADWYSHSEGLFCHMASKTLFPACKDTEEEETGKGDGDEGNEVQEDCFDVALNKIREKSCGEGRLCGRAAKAGVAGKVYKRVEDSRAVGEKSSR